MDSSDGAALAVRSPLDLLAAVPYLLGFHPESSLVVGGLRAGHLIFTARIDLPPPDASERAIRSRARQVAAVVGRQGVSGALLIGYGPAEAVRPLSVAVRAALRARHVPIEDELRVEDGRYYSLTCTDGACCPPEGRSLDPSCSTVPAAATVAGELALKDRAALVARIAPVDGAAREAATAATDRADDRLSALLAAASRTDLLGARALRDAGLAALEEAIAQHRAGDRLGDDDVAWLTVVLLHAPVRDHAWIATEGSDWAIDLWTDVLRRAAEDLVAAPATLLSFAAWQAGRGPLANVALDRALRADPTYPPALLMEEVLWQGIPPDDVDGWPLALGVPLPPHRAT
jgi:Domain of unknown function (DUF4192)